MYLCWADYVADAFMEFARGESMAISISFDVADIRICTLQKHVGSRWVYAWTLTSTNAEGKEMQLYQELATPTSSTAGGIRAH